jgi:hypothetical protein
MLRSHRLAVATLAAVLVAPPAFAQVPTEPTPAQIAQAIRSWMAGFRAQRFGAKSVLRGGSYVQPEYAEMAQHFGYLEEREHDRVTHLDMLGKFLAYAERHPSSDLGDAVLDVAAAGFDEGFLDRDAMELREIGHWTLMRTEHAGAWFVVLRAAAGEQVPVLADLRQRRPAEGPMVVGPARRVAALQLLGRKNLPVFRSTVEAALTDADPRVRLGAAECLLPPLRPPTARALAAALAGEHHPVVAQAFVRALLSMLKHPGCEIPAADRPTLVHGAFARFGQCGWRTDMELLDVIAAFPDKAAIPYLLQALEGKGIGVDPLLATVNKHAGPLLRQRALDLLKGMTGALVPNDDPAAWREFWSRECDRLVVPLQLPSLVQGGTRASFFGLPINGTSVAFLIDTSGSMDKEPAQPMTGPRRRGADTRLAAAKEQLLACVQAMPEESSFLVLTFADGAKRWTGQPVKAGKQSVRSLTELMSRMRPHGGTNLYEGLVTALDFANQRYGEVANAGIDELFVLSDGEPTTGEVRQPDEILALVQLANKYSKIRIHGVFTGDGNGAGLLRSLAEQNGGVFVQR